MSDSAVGLTMDEYIELGGKIERVRTMCRHIQQEDVDAETEAGRISDAMDEIEELLKA